MKKLLLFTLVVVAVIAMAGCVSAPPANVQPTLASAVQTAGAGANAAGTAAAGAATTVSGAATQLAPQVNTAVAAASTAVVTVAAAATAAAPTAVPPTAPPPTCALIPGLAAPAAGALGSPDKPITIAFVPSGDVPTITKAGNAVANCLTKMTGWTYNIQVATSFGAAIEAIGAGKAQISFLNTFAILLGEKKYGIIPVLVAARKYSTVDIDPDKGLAGQLETFYKGQFITKNDSGVKAIGDLKGKTFCFVDPASTSGYIVPTIFMKANGLNPESDVKGTFSGSHDNVALAVYHGDCDAGATFIDARTDAAVVKAAADISTTTAPFFVTDRIPNDGMQVAKDLDPKIASTTVDAILAMMADPGGHAAIKSAYAYDSLQKVDPTFYDAFGAVLVKAGVDPSSYVK